MMTRDVISVEADDDIRVAASRMMIFGIGGLAVEEDSGPTTRPYNGEGFSEKADRNPLCKFSRAIYEVRA